MNKTWKRPPEFNLAVMLSPVFTAPPRHADVPVKRRS
jgi:hypothetical protein